jgi:hypothetical protein
VSGAFEVSPDGASDEPGSSGEQHLHGSFTQSASPQRP